MSFIFDALKKSEDQRRRGEVPDLRAEHVFSPAPRPRMQRWPLVLTGALLLNALILLWWATPWQKEEQAAVLKAPAARLGPAPPAAELPASSPPVQASSVEDKQTSLKTPTAAKVEADPASSTRIAVVAPVEKDISALPDSRKTAPAPAGWSDLPAMVAPPPATKGKVPVKASKQVKSAPALPHLDDLPVGIRRHLPNMEVSLHYFTAEPGSRMVRLNGRILREGGSVAEGLQIEEITPSGLIMNWGGERFRIGEH